MVLTNHTIEYLLKINKFNSVLDNYNTFKKMPPKRVLSTEQIIFVNVSNNYAKSKCLNVTETLPCLFEAQFNETISYTTLAKFFNTNEIDINYQNELISSSKLKIRIFYSIR